jgi:hypothetical protein
VTVPASDVQDVKSSSTSFLRDFSTFEHDQQTVRKIGIILLLLSFLSAYSDILPRHGASLHYINIYFEEEFQKDAVVYELQVFLDSAGVASAKPIRNVRNKIPAFGAELNWSSSYFWTVVCYDQKNIEINKSPFHVFKIIGVTRDAEFDEFKMDIVSNNKSKHSQGLLLLDCARGIYDYNGKALWVLPDIPGLLEPRSIVRDLKFTPDNTVTFLTQNTGMEMDLDGNILWRLPDPFIFNSDTITFHHDFRKTAEGNYFVLGNKLKYRRVLGQFDQAAIAGEFGLKVAGDTLYKKSELGIVFEFDRDGKVIWHWDSDNYFTDEDLNAKKSAGGFPMLNSHMNAFGVNKENTKVFVGFRDLGRIIKIDKSAGKVDLQYGSGNLSVAPVVAGGLFNNQHDATVTNHRSLLVFNNGKMTEPSRVMELRENAAGQPVLWQFSLKFDSLSDGKARKAGNVIELPNGNLLVCGGTLNRNFEVTRDKKIVWNAFMMGKRSTDSLWQPVRQYRMNWVRELLNYHFLPELYSATPVKNDSVQIVVYIHNTGNATDAFNITALKGERETFSKKTTAKILSGEKATFRLMVSKNDWHDNKLFLRIRSVRSKTVKRLVLSSP